MNLKIGRFKHKFTAENKMKMQIANAIFQNLFQIWIDSKTKKERLIFFPYQLGLLSFFQNMSSFMEVL